MNYGMYISASGALVSMHQQDVAAANLANVNTTAFKPDIAMVTGRPAERVESGAFHLPSNEMLERLGGGVFAARTRADLSPRGARATGGALDIAIRNEGFFALRDGNGLALTRDGSFSLDGAGRLVGPGGRPVLGQDGAEIVVPQGAALSIGATGEIVVDGAQVGRVAVVTPRNPETLRKAGENTFTLEGTPRGNEIAAADSPVRRVKDPQLTVGALEESGVNPINAMMAVTKASGAAQRNLRMIRAHDETMDKAINRLGRIG